MLSVTGFYYVIQNDFLMLNISKYATVVNGFCFVWYVIYRFKCFFTVSLNYDMCNLFIILHNRASKLSCVMKVCLLYEYAKWIRVLIFIYQHVESSKACWHVWVYNELYYKAVRLIQRYLCSTILVWNRRRFVVAARIRHIYEIEVCRE